MVVQAQEGRLTDSGRVLIATAVPAERDAVVRGLSEAGTALPAVDVVAVGVGPAAAAAGTATALTTAALSGRPYGLVVSAGIGGGFQPDAPLGSVVVADALTAADLGAETPDGFLPVTELGFGTVTHRPPPSLVRDVAAATGALTGTVLTVSTVTGTAVRAAELQRRHPGAAAEAMEGFGVAEAAAAHGVPVLEIRAVSNAVGPRDRAAWRIGDALAALTEAFGKSAPVLESWNRT
ncbi:futalosine hydrolase [Streptomyces sp. NPDC058695]|uniref:futalosine hydrolase n=1 Tax=Streptomyces sp. NPDC058695 TaxID=3346604 RepID=UPI00366147FB